MNIAPERTIVIPAYQPAYGVLPIAPRLFWPVAEPEGDLDYGVDVTAPLAAVSDSIESFQLSVFPFGTGELQISALQLVGTVVGLMAAGGLAGRHYVVRLEVFTAAARVFAWRLGLEIDAMAGPPPPKPANPGFGPPQVWAASQILGADGAPLVGVDGAHLQYTR